MKPSFQIWLRAALTLLLAFAGLFGELVHTARAYAPISAATQGSTITYDDEGNVAYDSSYRSPFGYDGGATPPENKYGHQLSGYRAPFGIFSDFLAAEGGTAALQPMADAAFQTGTIRNVAYKCQSSLLTQATGSMVSRNRFET
jgi:hypothetical protein